MIVGMGPLEGDLSNESGTLIKAWKLSYLPPCKDTGKTDISQEEGVCLLNP